jgi:hypothetical protein
LIQLKNNENLTDKEKFMILETISAEEVLSFQNEYIQIITFNKNFLTYTMNKIKETDRSLKDQIIQQKVQIQENDKYIKDLQRQKDNLYKLILK